jgi:hypothetical protein
MFGAIAAKSLEATKWLWPERRVAFNYVHTAVTFLHIREVLNGADGLRRSVTALHCTLLEIQAG